LHRLGAAIEIWNRSGIDRAFVIHRTIDTIPGLCRRRSAMERIQVCVDFSETSRQAFTAALELSKAWTAPLHVIHVISTVTYGAEYAQMLSVLGPGAEELGSELMEFILAEFKGNGEEFSRVDQKILEGNEADEILEEAERWGATMLVLGSHGRSAIEKMFLGSVSSRVLSRSKIPTLIVHRDHAGGFKPQRILAAVDGSGVTAGVLRTAASWAKALGAQLDVLHVMRELPDPMFLRFYPDSDLRPNMRALMEQVRKDVEDVVQTAIPDALTRPIVYRVGAPYQEICEQAEEGKHDLVVIGAHQKHGVLDLGNTAARVAQRCPRSVLIVRPADEPEAETARSQTARSEPVRPEWR
jgi:nucleotide-binding universal stress UspA family protein